MLENFFESLSKEKDIIKTTTYSEYIKKYPPVSKIYIPNGSYEEMLTWVLPAKVQDEFHSKLEELKKSNENEIITRFMRGGFWRNYFSKYSESNRMNKRMIYASNIFDRFKFKRNKDKIKEDKEIALDYLLQGQCNCPYWHGTFGGLYLNNLRHATYSNLIKSTSISEKNIYGENYFIKKNIDFDMDGRDEVIISSEKETLIFHSLSGSLIEWDLKKETPINLIDTLKRREEAYHISAMRNANNDNQNEGHVSIHEIAKKIDEKIAKYLVFDKNEKVFGVDHFLNKMPNAEEFQLLQYEENANFFESFYKIIEDKIYKDFAKVIFKRKGKINGKEINLIKKYIVNSKGGFLLEATFENKSGEEIEFVYALENNITLLAGGEKDRYYTGEDKRISENLSETGEWTGKIFAMMDEAYIKIKILIEAEEETTFLYMPNYTISDAVDKLEMNYQNSTIVCLKKINLKPNEKKYYKIKVNTKNI